MEEFSYTLNSPFQLTTGPLGLYSCVTVQQDHPKLLLSLLSSPLSMPSPDSRTDFIKPREKKQLGRL